MFRLLENLTDGTFRFPHPLGDHFGAFDADEVGLSFVGNGFCEEGFSSSGCAEQDDSSGRLDAEVFEEFWLGKRPFNCLLYTSDAADD